uniref:Radial spoke head 3 n=1 Tax=Poecilia latipinna TaxID=48699 RepID=A0A3B3W2N0_9TELE
TSDSKRPQKQWVSILLHLFCRQNRNQLQYGNIMYDRRVVRGNLHDQQNNNSDPGMQQRQQAYRRRAIARKQSKEQLKTKTPEAIQGRQHVVVQTGETLYSFLEELSNIIQVSEIDCQTDEFLDKPSTPLFVPAKSGVDVETQIEEGDLFDFDLEVQPVLEVLVGKTIEQSLLEVMEEEELACLRTQQRVFQELRNNELAEVQRLEEQERRYREEKERRVAQQKEVLKKEQETAEKIAARVFSQQYLAGLLPAVFSSLRRHGYFYDPVEKDISVNFLPWLIAEVNKQLDKRYTAREVLDNIIYEVTLKRLEDFKHLKFGQDCSDS